MALNERTCQGSANLVSITSGTERKRGFVGIVSCRSEPLVKSFDYLSTIFDIFFLLLFSIFLFLFPLLFTFFIKNKNILKFNRTICRLFVEYIYLNILLRQNIIKFDKREIFFFYYFTNFVKSHFMKTLKRQILKTQIFLERILLCQSKLK